ncbi:hypothetical protein [Spongiactinospora sp. TRM90649]|uniref:hypothetical protein n=1 Tax=Spongiactinospora sp. TRM90649 TaxID=3031114 RepID=UPI0023F872BF|nr:hypothetical protein [Spongiactinospora sp. TRM90649]MDF5752440.1 hypothetical protein [Spongiactinospora sp. TRM90649]
MRRVVIMILLAAAAVTVFAAGRLAPDRVEERRAGRLYAIAVTIEDPAARPVTAAVRVERGAAVSVSVSGRMPQMGHVTPEVAARRGEDRFTATGALFGMSGVWELAVRVRGTDGEEVITVPVLVPA